MKYKVMVVLIVLAITMGCTSTKYISKHALIDPAQAVSVPHPVEFQKSGVKEVTVFQSILPLDCWVEIVANGGVWPVLAGQADGEEFKGYAYLIGMDYWGNFILEHIFCASLKDQEILFFNRDAGWAYNLLGQNVKYNPKKFDQDKVYRKDIFLKKGMTLSQLEKGWLDYFKSKGLDPKNLSSVYRIKVGSPEWSQFKERLANKMSYRYKMADGQIRSGYLPLDDFQQIAVEMPGFSGGERFVKNFNIPLIPSWVGLGISVLNASLAAATDTGYEGFYRQAQVLRRDMTPLIHFIAEKYKKLLEDRDKIIQDQYRIISNLDLELTHLQIVLEGLKKSHQNQMIYWRK
ncbi:hypothetical protein KKF83_01970 [Patescibacteria group bacterium]|nr:hypothetical protein [Patescibacteria group bacterium]